MELVRGAFLISGLHGAYTGAMERTGRPVSRSEEVTVLVPGAGLMALRPWEYVEARLYFDRVWEPESTRLIERRISPGEVAIDIGANVGYHALLMGHLVGPAGRVYAAEPSPSIRARLDRHLQLNSVRNVVVLPFGVSNRTEERYLRRRSETASGDSRPVDPADETSLVGKLPLRRLVDLAPAEDLARTALIRVGVDDMAAEILEDLMCSLAVLPWRVTICAPIRRIEPGAERVDALVEGFQLAGFELYRLDNGCRRLDDAGGDSRPPERVESLPSGQHDVAFVRG